LRKGPPTGDADADYAEDEEQYRPRAQLLRVRALIGADKLPEP